MIGSDGSRGQDLGGFATGTGPSRRNPDNFLQNRYFTHNPVLTVNSCFQQLLWTLAVGWVERQHEPIARKEG